MTAEEPTLDPMRAMAESHDVRAVDAGTQRAVERLAASYDALPPAVKALAAGLGTISLVGPVLQTYVTERATQARWERVGAFTDDVRAMAEELDRLGRRVDRLYTDSDAYGELFIHAARAAAESHQREKIRLLAQAFLNAALDTPHPHLFRELALQLVADLRAEHI